MNRNLTSNFGRGSRLTLSLLTAILILVSSANSFAAPPPPDNMISGTVPLPPDALSVPADFVTGARAPSNPKLDSTMAGLAAAAKDSVTEALTLAQSQSLRLSSNRVHVQIVTDASGLDNTIAAVAEAGGEVTGVGNDDTLVQGWLPVEALETVAAEDNVFLIRRPAEVVLFEDLSAGNSTTEGLAVINGPAWHGAGYTGAGIKVGVIDGGFEGYTGLLGTDLPASVTVRNFVDGENDGDIEDDGDSSTENHGLACAEIIHDIAPGATLYLAKISTNLDLQEAVTWLKDTHGVDVISTSLGWYNLTPGDGTGEFADLVEDARDAGILWVTAASNDREAHWGGLYADSDSDGYHEFNGKEINCFGPGTGGCYNINPGFGFMAALRWNDWTNVNQDYDMHLVQWTGSGWSIIASSTNTQNGSPGQTPTEFAIGLTSGTATAYGIVIERISSSQTVNFELFAPKFLRPDEILHARSLSNLADAPDAMTVAALDVTSPYPQESYSSEGPTNGPGGAETGGFTKPDISGYANVSTESYGAGGFNGTSAATPHVAGAAALVLSAYPSYTPAQVQSFLEGRAIDKGSSGMDTLYGYGRLYLDSAPSATAPTVTSITPNSGYYTETVSITNLAGSNFQLGATVKLTKSSESDINGTSVVVVNDSRITCDFDLNGATVGQWNVVVTNPDSESGTLPNGFTVKAPGDEEDSFVYLPTVVRDWPPPETVKLYPEADATVLQGTASSNWGSMTTLRVGYDYGGCSDSVNGKIGRALVRFDLSSIPAGATITDAQLHLRLVGYCYYTGHSQNRTVTVYRANSSWLESGVTWNNKPGYTSPSTSQSVPVNTFGWHTFDVTDLVDGWLSGSYANNGVVVRAPETSGDDFVRLEYGAREYSGTSYDPYLEVTYVGGSVSAQGSPTAEEIPASSSSGSYQSVLGIPPSPLEFEPLDCARMTPCSTE